MSMYDSLAIEASEATKTAGTWSVTVITQRGQICHALTLAELGPCEELARNLSLISPYIGLALIAENFAEDGNARTVASFHHGERVTRHDQ